MGELPEYVEHDGLGLASLVRAGDVSAAELVETCIARIERIDPYLHAVVQPMYQQARAAARSVDTSAPFAGVPFLVKDLLQAIRGVPTTSGSRFWRGWVPDYDSTLYRRWTDAGLITVGRSSTPELGIKPVTETDLYGATRNPWDLSRTSGGSSGGAGAAVAAGIVPLASGGDGGGSIRIPAACCGVFGLKPTRGRNPMGPDRSEGWGGFAVEHVLSRSVRDSAAALDATCAPEDTAPYRAPMPARPYLDELQRAPGKLRIAFHAEPTMPSNVHADCLSAVRDVATLCEELGHQVEVRRPGHDAEALALAFFTCIACHISAEIDAASRVRGKAATADEFEVDTWLLGMFGRVMTGADLVTAQQRLQTEARRWIRLYRDVDVVLTPTLGMPPVEIGALGAHGLEARVHGLVARSGASSLLRVPGLLERAVGRVYEFVPFTPLANFVGLPSMSVPLVWNAAGLPIGTMFTGRFGDEATLFRLAAQLEQARPWSRRRPTGLPAGII